MVYTVYLIRKKRTGIFNASLTRFELRSWKTTLPS